MFRIFSEFLGLEDFVNLRVWESEVKHWTYDKLDATRAAYIFGMLAKINASCVMLGFTSSCQQGQRLLDGPITPATNWEQMALMIHDFRVRIQDDLAGRLVFLIPTHKDRFYTNPVDLFGSDVRYKFPLVNDDIEESGRCFACGRQYSLRISSNASHGARAKSSW
jgi:hypothetical protein